MRLRWRLAPEEDQRPQGGCHDRGEHLGQAPEVGVVAVLEGRNHADHHIDDGGQAGHPISFAGRPKTGLLPQRVVGPEGGRTTPVGTDQSRLSSATGSYPLAPASGDLPAFPTRLWSGDRDQRVRTAWIAARQVPVERPVPEAGVMERDEQP